jgi:hypothetical protein
MTRSHRVRPLPASWLTSLLVVASCVLLPSRVAAQGYDVRSYDAPANWEPLDDRDYDTDWSDDIPAHIAVVDGEAWHEREGFAEGAEQNIALLAGDRLRTARGRLEVLFADGSALDLDEGTDVELLSESLLRLNSGRVRLSLARSSNGIDYRVDAAGTTTWIRAAGTYRITMGGRGPDAEVRLAVLRGVAEMGTPYGRTLVQAGYEAIGRARSAPSRPYYVNATSLDSFDRWVEARHDERTGYGEMSARYLPEEIRYYSGVMDRYGSWSYDHAYGYVWYPRVTADWRPYYDGRWSFVGSFGWFWIGATNWSWPTHHYGRWGSNAGRWYWIPDRRWAPAWVSWASAPGYVGWCPLGWDNRPVFHFSVTTYDTWRGWTVVPSRSWAPNVHVRRYAVNGRTAVPRDLRFVERQVAPFRPSNIRGTERPLRAPTTAVRTRVAQPRDGRAIDARPTPGVVSSASGRTIAPRASAASGGSTTPRASTTPRGRTADTSRAVRQAPENRADTSSSDTSAARVYRSPEVDSRSSAGSPGSGARTRVMPGGVERSEPARPGEPQLMARPRAGARQAPESRQPSGPPPRSADQPQRSAPQGRIDSRPAPAQRVEREAPPSREPAGRAAPDRGASREGSRPRAGGSDAPAPRPDSGSGNGRTAPSGSGSGTARARGR